MKILIMLSFFNFFSPKSGIVEVKDFGSNPGNLQMYQYVPAGLDKNAPLVVVLHGCIQNADTIAVQSGWNKLADEHKFMVLYPQQKMVNNLKKCFNWYMESDMQRDSGETASIKQMIDFAIKENKIDNKRVFITGISGGGAMTSVVMANFPGTFNAGAVMAGIPFGAAKDLKTAFSAMKGETVKTGKKWANAIKSINPDYNGKYPRIALFHGVKDPYVAIVNSKEIAKQYASIHSLENEPEIIKNFDENPKVTIEKYKDANNMDVVILYSINMGHGISVDPGKGEKQGGKKSTFSHDTNFHSTYWTAKFFGIVE